MDFVSIINSYGFRGKYWAKGEVATDITEDELKSVEICNYFKQVKDVEVEVEKPIKESRKTK